MPNINSQHRQHRRLNLSRSDWVKQSNRRPIFGARKSEIAPNRTVATWQIVSICAMLSVWFRWNNFLFGYRRHIRSMIWCSENSRVPCKLAARFVGWVRTSSYVYRRGRPHITHKAHERIADGGNGCSFGRLCVIDFNFPRVLMRAQPAGFIGWNGSMPWHYNLFSRNWTQTNKRGNIVLL